MKYKFVKKGTEISPENVKGLMDFGQVMDKAAGMGMGAAPLAKGALGVKAVSLTKIIAVLAIPFSVVVYFAIDELFTDTPQEPIEQLVEIEQSVPVEIIVSDSLETEQAVKEQEITQKATDVKPQKAIVQQVPMKQADEKEEDRTYNILSKEDIMIKAEPIGGFLAFYDLIDRELTYPENARISNTEGFVRVYFVVDKEGKAGKFRVVRSLGNTFDEEALRVMSKIPDWTPATHNGQLVSSHMSIKLIFKLEK